MKRLITILALLGLTINSSLAQTRLGIQLNLGHEAIYFNETSTGRFDPGASMQLEINTGYFELGLYRFKTIRENIIFYTDTSPYNLNLTQWYQGNVQFLFGCGRRFHFEDLSWGYGLKYLYTPPTFNVIYENYRETNQIRHRDLREDMSDNHLVMLNLYLSSKINDQLSLVATSSGGYLWDEQTILGSVDIIFDIHFGIKYYPKFLNRRSNIKP